MDIVKGWRAFVFCGLAILAGGCSKDPSYRVEMSSRDEIRYSGMISSSGVNAVLQLYRQQEVKPDVLRIDSKGGEVRAGLRLGQWVRDEGLSVRVKRLCASSCANYVFTAAKLKILDEQAVLAWHGGVKQANLLQQIKDSLSEDYIPSAHHASIRKDEEYGEAEATCPMGTPEGKKLNAKEQEAILARAAKCLAGLALEEETFFSSVGVDPMLPYYGQQGDYVEMYESAQYFGFDYSLQDLQTMGLENIQLKDEAWNPELSKYYKKYNVYRVALSGASVLAAENN